ncbi:MAG: ligand-binding SRPBCC domain-containing protein [Bacteroidia bacterium]|jgi:ligand-binding SRPBCC domain-containing protein
MKNTIIKRHIAINASKEKVWNALADFGNVQNLSPNIKKSFLTSTDKVGLGSTRHCDFYSFGASVDEKIIAWDEGNSMKIELFNLKNLPMVSRMGALFELEEKNGQTLINGTFEYHMSNSLGQLLNKLKMEKMNTKSWEAFLAGIKHNLETGENVDKGTPLDLSVVTD